MEAFKEPLTKEEEAVWLERLKNGEQHAKEVLVEHNLRLVAHIVKKYGKGEGLSEDLLSVGTIGLIKAVNSYSDEKGTKLGTYASKCIENEILMQLRGDKKKSREVSFYEPVGTDNEGKVIHLLDIIECDDIDIVEQLDNDKNILLILNDFKQILEPREQEIIILRYGLGGIRELTQKEIATKLNISRSYVSRIEKKALAKLRDSLVTKGDKL